MKRKTALTAILVIAIAGMMFSGYLSYVELGLGKATCPILGTSIFGLPACVYGFVMYLVVFVIALFGLKARR